jgi:hypothetical protein
MTIISPNPAMRHILIEIEHRLVEIQQLLADVVAAADEDAKARVTDALREIAIED